MAIDYPPVFINNYLADKITDELSNYFDTTPRDTDNDGIIDTYPLSFFPTQPTSIDTLTEEFPEASENVFAVYDRMFRMRRSPFPHKRTEQLLYYFYKTSGGMEALIETTQKVADLLDNGDESAEDINRWITGKYNEQDLENKTDPTTGKAILSFGAAPFRKSFYLPYFHEFKIYQLEEARDIIDFGTARTYAGNKIIIEYCWHKSQR